MNDDETTAEFNVWVMDLANELFALGEKITEFKMVQKVLRSLPPRFSMKVTTIEEANDITTMKLDELFGLLHMFELSFEDQGTQNLEDVMSMEKLRNNCDGLDYDYDRYFDSGCSRHMIGISFLFTELIECKTGQVTFGDGVQHRSTRGS
ncbi:Receptor-like protein 12 [Cucumis melo var. makuwa]|uniref:Receptor-like protein 12 n=1 Tax=Cucumis melo var. makuwa TaxID=1194695 RepID=A0A5A7TEK2_CUCMM|nr:Receptor-like protein 12 [Cucumis melo var. makuwa]